ncbi:MAG: MBL fold metallo-hydrolase [Burkholderiales bacterium]|nr:MBL fold metallo-hydrolase [Burkholderiales bacterium]
MTPHRLLRSWIACALLWLTSLLPAAAQQQDKMNLHKVADGIYMMQNARGSSNSTFVITSDGVLVFDADVRTADQVLAAIRSLTDKKVRYVVISHSAGDHATGGWHYREDRPTFIATRKQTHDLYTQEALEFQTRKASSDPRFASYKNSTLVLPDIAFEGALTLHFGGLTFQLVEEGYGHTTSDVTVYIPQKRIMLMGDLLDTEIHPGQGESGNTLFSQAQGWINILERVINRHLPVDTYVPGHGPVHIGRGVADLEEQKRYFIVMRNEVAKMVSAGKTLEQIQKEFVVPPEFARYQAPARLNNFLKLFYHQLIEKGY